MSPTLTVKLKVRTKALLMDEQRRKLSWTLRVKSPVTALKSSTMRGDKYSRDTVWLAAESAEDAIQVLTLR